MSQTTTCQIELDELPTATLERIHSLDQIKTIQSNRADVLTGSKMLSESQNVNNSDFEDTRPLEGFPLVRSPGLRFGNFFIDQKVLYLLGSCMGVFTVGLNDTATGANLPSIQKHYNLSYETISLVFLAGFGGKLVSSILNPVLQNLLGTRWLLLTAGVLYAGGSLLIAFAPPFSLVMVGLALMGFGGGFYAACLTSVIAHFDNSSFMNILYAFFGVGALSAPFIIGGFASASVSWNLYYWIQFTFGMVIIFGFLILFKNYVVPSDAEPEGRTLRSTFIQFARMRITWIGIILTIFGFAITLTLSNWLTSYLIEVKGTGPDISRYQLSMLWAGMTAGRMFFSLPYIRIRDRFGNALLLALLCGAIVVLWLAKTTAANWVVIAAAGFFLGPNTPAILSIVSARVPISLKGAAVSITLGFGLIGAALGPLIFGIAVGKIVPGLQVLPPVLIVLSTLSALTFWAIPPREKRD